MHLAGQPSGYGIDECGAGTDDTHETAAFIEIEACRIALACVYAQAVEAVQGRTAWVRRSATLRRRRDSSRRREASAPDRQRALTWAQRLKRVFAIEIETCRRCGGRLRVIASIEARPVIARIFEHLDRDAESVDPAHPYRAPPEGDPPL